MKRFWLMLACALALFVTVGTAQQGPYKVLRTAKVGGDGGFDYVNADSAGRRLYVARSGPTARLTIWNLDTLMPTGEIPAMGGIHGAVVDPKSHHGIASTKPITYFDSNTGMPISKIDVMGNPDGLLFEPSTATGWVLSHAMPHVTVIDMATGTVKGTIDLGGQPEQAASDGAGKVYIDLEDKASIAVVDAKTMMVTAKYDLMDKGGFCAGLALDVKNQILFAACRMPANMVMLSAKDGHIITTIPISPGTDGATFNPQTMEAFSSQGDGTLSIIKENSPTNFVLEQTLQTMTGGKTLTLDAKTGHIFIIAAEYGQPAPPAGGAAPAAGGRGGRGPMIAGSFSILEVGK
jgi:hypothetical protein